MIFFPGGLPGAGSDAKTKIVKLAAATIDGKTLIQGSWTGQIEEGKMSGKSASGQPFALTRVCSGSPTLGVQPPVGAVLLFDGSGTDSFTAKAGSAKMSADRLLKVPATSKRLFKDFHLHVEFQIPYRGPSGGNSGVYLAELLRDPGV